METPAPRAMVPRLVEALRICRGQGIKVIYTTRLAPRVDFSRFRDTQRAS
jgi:hypothetical protein